MLMRLLSGLAEGKTSSYASLGKELGVSERLLKQILQDLSRMGYIESMSRACDTGQCKACHKHCTVNKSNVDSMLGEVWVLTERGRQAARTMVQVQTSYQEIKC